MSHDHALTIKADGIARVIESSVGVSLPFIGDPSLEKDITIKTFKGIWDTGASGSVITLKVAEELGLHPTGKKQVHTASNSGLKNTYLVNIYLPMGVAIPNVTVTEGVLPRDIEVLIGMDIITVGDFTITHKDGKTKMTFGVPAHKDVDYVQEITDAKEANMLSKMNHDQRRSYEAQKRKGKI